MYVPKYPSTQVPKYPATYLTRACMCLRFVVDDDDDSYVQAPF